MSTCFWELSWCCCVVSQPANSFRAHRRISEWTGSSASPSGGSFFGRPYGTEAFRLSPRLTSRNWQRHPRCLPYAKFWILFPYSVCQHFLFFGSCQGLLYSSRLLSFPFLSVSLAPAGGYSVAESPFQPWQGHRLCAGCRGYYSLVLPAFVFWLGHCETAEWWEAEQCRGSTAGSGTRHGCSLQYPSQTQYQEKWDQIFLSEDSYFL